MCVSRLRLLLGFVLFSLIQAGPSKPEIYLGINRESLDKGLVGALEPTVKWQTSGTVADFDVEGGFAITVADPSNMPYGVWGRIRKTIGKVTFMAQADTTSSRMNQFDLDLQASLADSSVQVESRADVDDSTLAIQKVRVTQAFDTPRGGRLTLKPGYSLPARKGDVKLLYSISDFKVTIDADQKKQKIAVEKRLGVKAGSIKPSITSNGDVELEYSRPIGSGVLAATYKPKKSVDLKYTDGPWEAIISAPADNLSNLQNRVNFRITRAFDVAE